MIFLYHAPLGLTIWGIVNFSSISGLFGPPVAVWVSLVSIMSDSSLANADVQLAIYILTFHDTLLPQFKFSLLHRDISCGVHLWLCLFPYVVSCLSPVALVIRVGFHSRLGGPGSTWWTQGLFESSL